MRGNPVGNESPVSSEVNLHVMQCPPSAGSKRLNLHTSTHHQRSHGLGHFWNTELCPQLVCAPNWCMPPTGVPPNWCVPPTGVCPQLVYVCPTGVCQTGVCPQLVCAPASVCPDWCASNWCVPPLVCPNWRVPQLVYAPTGVRQTGMCPHWCVPPTGVFPNWCMPQLEHAARLL